MSLLSPVKSGVLAISFDEFVERFVPMPNTITAEHGFDCGRGACLYATSGVEAEYIYQRPEKHVWTLLDGHRLLSGRHMENRTGFVVCEVSVAPGLSYVLDLMEG